MIISEGERARVIAIIEQGTVLDPDLYWAYAPTASLDIPECEERKCVLAWKWVDVTCRETIWQHGANPEHRIKIPSVVEGPASSIGPPYYRRRLREWTEHIHDYEEGRWSPLGTGPERV